MVDSSSRPRRVAKHSAFDGGGVVGTRRLPQHAEERCDLAHFQSSRGSSRGRSVGQHRDRVKAKKLLTPRGDCIPADFG